MKYTVNYTAMNINTWTFDHFTAEFNTHEEAERFAWSEQTFIADGHVYTKKPTFTNTIIDNDTNTVEYF